jgi:hypothetical protein
VPKKLLALAKLPKPWNDMTDEEQRAWCESFAAVMKKNLGFDSQTEERDASSSSKESLTDLE